MSTNHPIPTTATKPLAEVNVLDRGGPTAEVTTATVLVSGRYAVDLDEGLTRAESTLNQVILRVRRPTSTTATGTKTEELIVGPEEFAVLAMAVAKAHATLFPPIAPEEEA